MLVEGAEYSVKMLMHRFMEILRRAKRQQFYKHLFTFDVLPQIQRRFSLQSERCSRRTCGDTLKIMKQNEERVSDSVLIELMNR